jgi:hypothetical protein
LDDATAVFQEEAKSFCSIGMAIVLRQLMMLIVSIAFS